MSFSHLRIHPFIRPSSSLARSFKFAFPSPSCHFFFLVTPVSCFKSDLIYHSNITPPETLDIVTFTDRSHFLISTVRLYNPPRVAPRCLKRLGVNE
uniref:Uncharacterized protein n=1 Tax=Caenorhabditis japonica TaxID=281687 RepID=A0A8R1ERU8_CAEJA